MGKNVKHFYPKEISIYNCIHFDFTTFCLFGEAVSANFTDVLTKSMFSFFVVTICSILYSASNIQSHNAVCK